MRRVDREMSWERAIITAIGLILLYIVADTVCYMVG